MSSKDTNNVVQGQFGASARRAKNQRSTLCANGHHKWEVEKKSHFDVKQGRLVTLFRCARCGETRTKAL